MHIRIEFSLYHTVTVINTGRQLSMKTIQIYTKPHCPYCHRAKALLDNKGVEYQEIDISIDDDKRAEMMRRSQRQTVPQIFIDQIHVGGSDDLVAADNDGTLDLMLITHGQNAPHRNHSSELI